MLLRPLATIALCAGVLAACGGSSEKPEQARTQTAPLKLAPTPSTPFDLPAGVPLKPVSAADPDQAKVVRAWSAALRAGDIAGASALWAVPSKVQNATPVLTLRSRADVLTFNGALPCGSVVVSAGSAKGYTIATVRLTKRKGARCDAAAGAIARTAILVRGGKIAAWYRLPDDPDAPGPQPGASDDIESTTI